MGRPRGLLTPVLIILANYRYPFMAPLWLLLWHNMASRCHIVIHGRLSCYREALYPRIQCACSLYDFQTGRALLCSIEKFASQISTMIKRTTGRKGGIFKILHTSWQSNMVPRGLRGGPSIGPPLWREVLSLLHGRWWNDKTGWALENRDFRTLRELVARVKYVQRYVQSYV